MVRRGIPEPPEPERDEDLEKTIADLIKVKNAAPEGSAEYLLAKRALAGLRHSYELAGPIIEDLDPYDWGGFSRDLGAEAPDPQGQVLPLRPRGRTSE